VCIIHRNISFGRFSIKGVTLRLLRTHDLRIWVETRAVHNREPASNYSVTSMMIWFRVIFNCARRLTLKCMTRQYVNSSLNLLTDKCTELRTKKHRWKCKQSSITFSKYRECVFVIPTLHSESPRFYCQSSNLLSYEFS
jgi:hypothetical protein